MNNANWQTCAPKTNPSSSNFYLTYYSSGSSSTCKYCVVEYHKGNDSWAISPVASGIGGPSHWCDLPDKP